MTIINIEKTPIIKRACDIKSVPLEWLWENRIPLGKLSLIIGVQGTGKSILTLYMAAQISNGNPWIDTWGKKREPASVIILSTEDDWADTIKPRLQAAEANMNNIYSLPGFTEKIAGQDQTQDKPLFDLTANVDILAKAVVTIPNVKLIVIDPISAFMSGKNENKNAETREYLNPIAAIAAARKIAIVGISHLNKNQDQSPEHRILGSTAMGATARACWLVHQDPEVSERKLMLLHKENLSPNSTGLAFRLASQSIMTDVGILSSQPYCMFEKEPVMMTAKDALQVSTGKSGRPSKKQSAMDWLWEFLSSGPKKTHDIFTAGKDAGYSSGTLKQIKTKNDIQTLTHRNEIGQVDYCEWSLPPEF